MNYIFCGAYKGLLFGLYLRYLGKEITVVTYNGDLIKYCKAEKIDYIEYEHIGPRITTFYQFFKLKKVLDETIKKIDFKKEDAFFLLGKTKGYDYFYLAKELSKIGKGYYKNPDREMEIYKAPKSKPIFIRGKILKFFYKIVLDLDLIYYTGNNGDPVLGIPNEFLKKYGIVEFKPDFSSEELLIDVVQKSKSDYKEFDNLIIDDRPLSMIKFESIKDLYTKLYDLPVDFAFKKHPYTSENGDKTGLLYYDIFKKFEEVPQHIPAELFYNNIRKNVIAVFSTALITASNLKHLKAISLLDLVEWYHEPTKKYFKDLFIKESNNRMLFPSNFEELKEILLKN